MNILITGYTGFIGSNITKSFKNHTLFGVDLVENPFVSKHFNWETLRDCRAVDCIIHLAGKAHDTKNTSIEDEYYNVNVGLTQKIFQYFLKSTATKFILFSSVKAVTDTVCGEYLTENDISNPQTPYGKSKLEAEQYVQSIPIPADKKIFILRPCMVHGPGNKGNLSLLYKLVKKGFPWPLGAFENSRSFSSIQNLLFVIHELIEKDINPGIYQIADDETLSTNDLIHLMADSLNRKAHIWNIPPNKIKLMAKTGDYLGLLLNSESLKKLTESYVVSNQKLKAALGIEKMPYTATEGMKKTFASFL